MYEVGNASKKGSAAALSMGYLELILLQYSLMFLLLDNALASRSACISISSSLRLDSLPLLFIYI